MPCRRRPASGPVRMVPAPRRVGSWSPQGRSATPHPFRGRSSAVSSMREGRRLGHRPSSGDPTALGGGSHSCVGSRVVMVGGRTHITERFDRFLLRRGGPAWLDRSSPPYVAVRSSSSTAWPWWPRPRVCQTPPSQPQARIAQGHRQPGGCASRSRPRERAPGPSTDANAHPTSRRTAPTSRPETPPAAPRNRMHLEPRLPKAACRVQDHRRLAERPLDQNRHPMLPGVRNSARHQRPADSLGDGRHRLGVGPL